MLRRILVGLILIPLFVASVLYLPDLFFQGLITGILLLALKELSSLLGRMRIQVLWPTLILTAVLPWAVGTPSSLAQLLTFGTLVILVSVLRAPSNLERSLRNAAFNLLSFLYLGIPFYYAAEMQRRDPLELLLLLVLIWISDSGAYFIGKAMGRHRVVPKISPGKSLEGFLGGLALPMVTAPFLAQGLGLAGSAWFYTCLAGLVAGVGILGDLFESLIKRSISVKNSAQLIPGHGGVLDRIDSLLFAIPAFYLIRF